MLIVIRALVELYMVFSGDKKVSQLEAVHLQHVQTNFDTKKRKSIERLMEEIQKSSPSVSHYTISVLLINIMMIVTGCLLQSFCALLLHRITA